MRRRLPRRCVLRRRRPVARGHRALPPRDVLTARRARVRGDRGRGARPSRRRLRVGARAAREPRSREVPPRRRVPRDQPGGRSRDPSQRRPGAPASPLDRGPGRRRTRGGRRRAGRIRRAGGRSPSERAPRSARLPAGWPERAARGGGGRAGDPAPVLERRDVARRDLARGARDARPRDGHRRRPVQRGRGRRGRRPVPHRAELDDQADRLRPLRRHPGVLRVRGRAPDQDRAGLEAGRGRAAPRAQGDGRDRGDPPYPAGRRAAQPGPASRHLLDRGPGPADLRSAAGEPRRRHLREARVRDRRRDDRDRCREGPRRHRPRRRGGRRDRRLAAVLDQERGPAVGDRARGDEPCARPQRAPPACAAPGGRRPQDRSRRGPRGAARRGRVLVRHGAPAGRGLHHGADLPPRHVPGRDRDAAPRAPGSVRRHPRDGRVVPHVRGRGCPAHARGPRAPLARGRDRPRGSAGAGRGGGSRRSRSVRTPRAFGRAAPARGDACRSPRRARTWGTGSTGTAGPRCRPAPTRPCATRSRPRTARSARASAGRSAGGSARTIRPARSGRRSTDRPVSRSARSSPPVSTSGWSARRTTTSARG